MKTDEKITLWSERIRAFQFSGQTCKTWCQEHHVPVFTMSYWMRKLKTLDEQSDTDMIFAKMPTEKEFRRMRLWTPVCLSECKNCKNYITMLKSFSVWFFRALWKFCEQTNPWPYRIVCCIIYLGLLSLNEKQQWEYKKGLDKAMSLS